ncbi:hypothetical protein DQ384_38070 [Sphaerisporangium album]|uniref:Uncharacterized protein n=1 Tax=Sphaerisporangium album TaxID=509200 RepID=A0A367EPG0_9ACTN|nr:hypothetical protein [Sphaerisporangium album]RCG19090.1 hypothetical protein DQ384_38070 [Sphaerisporangium album]
MSLTRGLDSPRTPLRRFLDRELSAGCRRLRATYRARLPSGPLILPGEGVGYEAGTVGTAIDQRLRLAFTAAAPIDQATKDGIATVKLTADYLGPHPAWEAIEAVGSELGRLMHSAIPDLALDDRARPFTRTDEDEERLARMLIAAAWFALNTRNFMAFPLTPLCKAAFADPGGFDLATLLALPHRHLVDDILAQLRAAEHGTLGRLRAQSDRAVCSPGPTFDGSSYLAADADLIVDGFLLEFKSTRRVEQFYKPVILQLLGYALMDFSDRYRIDSLGVYMTRAGALILWPLEDYLALLGARRRDLAELRAAFEKLLSHPEYGADNDPLPGELPGVEALLSELAPAIDEGCCRVCAQPLARPMISATRPRLYCSRFCSSRASSLRYHGWLT